MECYRKISKWRFASDVISVITFWISLLHIEFLFQKPKQGFFCDDITLHRLYKPQSVSSAPILLGHVIFAILIIILCESILWMTGRKDKVIVLERKIPGVLFNIYSNLMMYGLGMLACTFISHTCKRTLGRLRPHFFDVCQPVSSKNVSACNPDITQKYVYITDFTCKSSEDPTDIKRLNDIRFSFPSAVASQAMYSMFFLSIYLEIKWKLNIYLYIKYFLQITMVLFAIYVGCLRIAEDYNHETDVVCGLLLGGIYAAVVIYLMWDREELSHTNVTT